MFATNTSFLNPENIASPFLNTFNRSFPSMFRKERTSGKRRFPTPVTKAVVAPTKHTSLQFYLLPAPTDRTPQGSQELKLFMAGLGKRHISLPDNSNHAEVRVFKFSIISSKQEQCI